MKRNYEDLTGKSFGRWTVINEAEPKYYSNRRIRYWNCRCDCGVERAVKEQSLKDGSSNSCGCYHSDIMHTVGRNRVTHGQSNTRLYRVYRHMICRCTNPHDIRYARYGGRGIRVCDEWNSFEAFYQWSMLTGYDDTKSIDRIDNNGDYRPDNCRWVSISEQANNKSTTRLIEYQGESMSIAEWAVKLGMPYKKLHKRIYSGWSPEKALST